ncbi:MAG TPA: Flp pilus assembly protein CpaB, partial [bacterium]|nr:Flp pilus assembly protein CpaB [bacterium]
MTKIIIAIALSVAVVLFNYMYINSVKQEYESGDFAWIVRAKEPVEAFNVVNPDQIEVVRVDAKTAQGNMISLPGRTISPAGQQYLLNQVQFHITKAPLPEGIMVSQAMVAENLDDAFSRKIPEGMRAVTVNVDDTTGVAGLIRPGDRIDLVGNFEVQAGTTAKGFPIQGLFTQTILQNVEVLAVGKDAGIGLSEELVQDALQAQKQFSKPTSITLAVSPEDAQKVIHVRNAGTLSASLRPGPYNPADGAVPLKP